MIRLRRRSLQPCSASSVERERTLATVGFETLLIAVARTVIAVVRLVADWLARRRRGPADRLKHILALKAELANPLRDVLPPKTNGDAIIRELRRMDSYPDLDSLRAISPWFKV